MSHESGLRMPRDVDNAIGDYPARGRFVSVPAKNVFVMEQGSGSPVLFLHGIPTYSFLWRDVLADVSLAHRAIAPDLPGFGLSEKRRHWDYSVAAQADAIRSLLLQLEIDRVALVCHDFGALVGAELVARAPDVFTHLVILNTSLRPESWSGGVSPLTLLRAPVVGELAMLFSREWMLKRAMQVYVSRGERLTVEVMRQYWWPFEHGFRQTLINISRGRVASRADFESWRSTLAQLTVPALVIWGASDPSFTLNDAHDIARLIPDARLEIFERANHFVPEDRPRATARLINALLAGTL